MIKKVFFATILSAILTTGIFAQTTLTAQTVSRPRVVGAVPTPSPTPAKTVIITNNLPAPTATPVSRPTVAPTTSNVNPNPATNISPNPTLPVAAPILPQPKTTFQTLNFAQLKSKIAEAKSLLLSRPTTISSTEGVGFQPLTVRVAFYDWKTKRVDTLAISKDLFLTKELQLPLMSANGKVFNFKVLRANGVNTPVTIFDQTGDVQTPLLVQYPIERDNKFAETAYYVSTHTGVVTPEVITAGKLYVRNTIDIARENLRKKGVNVAPQIADIAERLATVEHVDHARFRNEYHQNIYNDIFTLYALNEGQTYRYSVSRAGAGGMVQMIPSTYYMVRNRYYTMGLMPDFEEGMKNHGNAAQAMLLYMQMTWDDLIANDTIYNAIENGTATPQELMAAGYNSNPAKLAGYIKRGGNGWRNLIPKETRIYLQIYSSLEKFVPMTTRSK